MATNSKFDELNLSKDEIDRFTNALKNEEFRKLFVEYAQEISDPENKARYEAEITQMESERGMDVKFVHPDAGYVVKTTANGETKLFVNFCKNEHIAKPSSRKQTGPDGNSGLVWSLPHSFAPPKEERDKKGETCKVIDFVVNPDTYRMAETNVRFRNMLHDTAFDGIEKQFDLKLDRKNLKFPKRKYMGTPTPTVIRTRQENGTDKTADRDPSDIMSQFPYPYGNESTAEMMKKREEEIEKKNKEKEQQVSKTTVNKQEKTADEYTVPKYAIKHQSNFDMQDFGSANLSNSKLLPDTLIVDVQLPLLRSAAPIDLDIFEKKLSLQSEKPAKYKLELDLPFAVDENEGSASFDKSKHLLSVKLPVIKPKISMPYEVTTDDTRASSPKLEDQTKPLIEVLGSTDSGVDVVGIVEETETTNPTIIPQEEPKYTLPPFKYSQTDETISYVIEVKNIVRESVVNTYTTQSPHGTDLKFMTLGGGGFPMYHKFCLRFPEGYSIELDNCDLRISDENAVLVFAKSDDCLGDWTSFYVGINAGSMQEKFFVTEAHLHEKLDAIDREVARSKAKSAMPENTANREAELEVTCMDMEKLEISIKGAPDVDLADTDTEDKSPTVIHSKETPRLHGILKQHTLSESSCDEGGLSSSYGRQGSIISSTDELTDSEESVDSCGRPRKKSVSFSDYVDRQTFKSNMSVTTMKASLRSKKRKAKKREERMQKKNDRQDRRRRRSSNSMSENSSDEICTGQGDDDVIEGHVKVKEVKYDSDDEVIDQGKVESDDEVVGYSRTVINKANEKNLEKKVEKKAPIEQKPPSKEIKKDDGDAPETMLSWKDGEIPDELKPKCAFDFSNSVMFDLDVD